MTSNAHSAPPQFLSWLTATLHYLLATSKRSTSSSKMEMTELLKKRLMRISRENRAQFLTSLQLILSQEIMNL